jgi:hypothetical protein
VDPARATPPSSPGVRARAGGDRLRHAIGDTASPHATPTPHVTPTQTRTPTPIPSPATTWRIIPSPNPTSSPSSGLVAVSALTPADVWAVGGTYTDCCRWQPLIERWDGVTWHIVPSPGTTRLQGVAALSPRDVWAVGSGLETYAPVNGPTLIEHWNGTQWSIAPSPNPSANDNSLASVAALAPNNVWAVGNYRSSTGASCCVHLPLIERWDGTAWHLVANPALPGAIDSTLTTVATIPGTKQLWAAGSVLFDHPASHPALIEQWDGTAWHLVASPTLSGALSSLDAVTTDGAGSFWAVGYYVHAAGNDFFAQTLIEHSP